MNSQLTPVFVAGHRGLVGSAIVRALARAGVSEPIVRTRAELDLRDQSAVNRFFEAERPATVFLAAARVGGIHPNSVYPWDFLHDNLTMQTNVLSAALRCDVPRLVFLGSSCIYPRLAPQPIQEDHLLTGPLEPTNAAYAIAKIAGVKLVEAANTQFGRRWVSLMPSNLYGPGDNFDLENSHVLPAMLRKFHEARVRSATGAPTEVTLWGSGTVLREFLYVDDLATASLHAVEQELAGLYNVGYGEDITVHAAAALIAALVGYDGVVKWDASKPDGTPRKLLDSSRIRATGWTPSVSLSSGLARMYEWYLAQDKS